VFNIRQISWTGERISRAVVSNELVIKASKKPNPETLTTDYSDEFRLSAQTVCAQPLFSAVVFAEKFQGSFHPSIGFPVNILLNW
jgi:hypothetical protein